MKQRITHNAKVFMLFLLLLVGTFINPTAAQAEQLGELDFPTSGSAKAQEHFLQGVKYLHNFGFEDAAAAFQAASKIEPDFVMAYWGEALSHNHPLQPGRDLETPRKVLARLGASPAERAAKAPTPREVGLLAAVEILYGEEDDTARSFGYAEAMGQLATQYPEVLRQFRHELRARRESRFNLSSGRAKLNQETIAVLRALGYVR